MGAKPVVVERAAVASALPDATDAPRSDVKVGVANDLQLLAHAVAVIRTANQMAHHCNPQVRRCSAAADSVLFRFGCPTGEKHTAGLITMRSLDLPTICAVAFVAVFVLWIYGGSALRDFSFTIMVGVIVGTYSSIFIASPVLTIWQERKRLR